MKGGAMSCHELLELKPRSLSLNPSAHRGGGVRDHRRHDDRPGPHTNVTGRVSVSRRSEAALDTEELALRRPIGLINAPTAGAQTTGIAGIDHLDEYPGLPRLVENEGFELK